MPCALAAPLALAQKVKWDLPAGYAEGNFHTQNLRWFADEVKKATKGDVDIQVHSNASLYKLPEIKRAVQGGQAPIGEILLSLHAAEDPVFEADMIPYLAAGFDKSWKLYTVQKPILQDRLGKQGMRMLYSVAWPGNGIFSKTPMDSLAAFKGAKFRAYNRVTARFAEELGAQPTTIQAAELAQAFTMNMATTMIASPQIGVDTKAWEFLTSFYDTNAMHPRNAVIVNEREFAKLSTREPGGDPQGGGASRGTRLGPGPRGRQAVDRHVGEERREGRTNLRRHARRFRARQPRRARRRLPRRHLRRDAGAGARARGRRPHPRRRRHHGLAVRRRRVPRARPHLPPRRAGARRPVHREARRRGAPAGRRSRSLGHRAVRRLHGVGGDALRLRELEVQRGRAGPDQDPDLDPAARASCSAW